MNDTLKGGETMGWRLKILFDDGSEELLDEVFDTEKAAEAEFREWCDSWVEGREVLQLAGENYIDADIDDCEIWEE